MERTILQIVADFEQWKGDVYRLSALVAEAQKERDRQTLADLGFTEASEAL